MGELVIGNGGAFDRAPDQIAIETDGEVAAIEAVGPFAAGSAAGAWR